jgi:hypothetical protein
MGPAGPGRIAPDSQLPPRGSIEAARPFADGAVLDIALVRVSTVPR